MIRLITLFFEEVNVMEMFDNLVIELCVEDSIVEIVFEKYKNKFESNEGIVLSIQEENDYCICANRIDKTKYYLEHTDEIQQIVMDEYNCRIMKYKESTQGGVDYSVEGNSEITVPYKPEYIKISPGRFSLKEIYDMIQGEDDFEPILDLSPDFQRNYVWDRTRKSRLIESILLNIPLPVFYLSRDTEGKYQVVDGVQRLSVINEYFSNGFRLNNLEYLKKECEWKYYNKKNADSLHPKFIRLLRTYQIDCNIIEPSTPIEVKFDIFKRLNTGGKSLNNQEIRNSIMKKEIRDFIRELAESEEFKTATGNSIKAKRMLDQEMVLRFIGFYFLYEVNYLDVTYNGNMNSFLDQLVEALNDNYNEMPLTKIRGNFYKSMDNAYTLFGGYAFRKVERRYINAPKNLINRALFTVFSVLLTRYEKDEVEQVGNLVQDFSAYLIEKVYLNESITYGTSDKSRIDTTFMLIEEFLETKLGV